MCNKSRRKISILGSFSREASKNSYNELSNGKQTEIVNKIITVYGILLKRVGVRVVSIPDFGSHGVRVRIPLEVKFSS